MSAALTSSLNSLSPFRVDKFAQNYSKEILIEGVAEAGGLPEPWSFRQLGKLSDDFLL